MRIFTPLLLVFFLINGINLSGQTPWRAQGQNYFEWYSDKVGLRIVEGLRVRPGLRYMRQNSTLTYLADSTILGGNLTIDDDVLNAVDLPGVIENRVRNINIPLPNGILTRENRSWTALASLDVTVLGVSFRGSYWSGALAPGKFPQPENVRALFNAEELVNIALNEIAASSALNNAVAYEITIRPLQILSGFRKLEYFDASGFFFGGDLAYGFTKTTDLTFKQGRELLGDLDLGQEVRDVLPDALEGLIDTDEAGNLLLTALEGRIPLYGFGIPEASGQTFELEGWGGYQWNNRSWAGDVRLGLIYQKQRLTNDHPSNPTLIINRWMPTVNVKWVFNKEETDSAILHR